MNASGTDATANGASDGSAGKPAEEPANGPAAGSAAGSAERSTDGGRAEPRASSRLVRLRILDKEVQLACHPDEESELMQAAAYVDRAMRELRQRNTTSSIEKIAIVTAINTASSLLKARSRAGDEGDAAQRVARLNGRLDELLTGGAGEASARVDGKS